MLFVGICALGEWFTCVFHVPDNVYRLLFYRYLFLLYLGCVILKFKINAERKSKVDDNTARMQSIKQLGV